MQCLVKTICARYLRDSSTQRKEFVQKITPRVLTWVSIGIYATPITASPIGGADTPIKSIMLPSASSKSFSRFLKIKMSGALQNLRCASLVICTVAATLFAAPITSEAATLTFGAVLSGANEVPPNTSPGAGSVAVVLDPTAQTLQIIVSFFNLTSNDIMAHIHCCAPLGSNVGVATTIPAFAGFPLGVTSGTYLSPVFDLTKAAFYNPAFVTLKGGLANAEAAFISGLETEQSYFNIHTINNPGGEIRGQLDPLGTVPLPAALPLFASGLVGLGLLGWLRKKTEG